MEFYSWLLNPLWEIFGIVLKGVHYWEVTAIGGGCALGEVLLYIIYGYNMIIWIIGIRTELSSVAFSSKIDCSLWLKDIFPNIKKLKKFLIDIVIICVYNEYQIVMTLKNA